MASIGHLNELVAEQSCPAEDDYLHNQLARQRTPADILARLTNVNILMATGPSYQPQLWTYLAENES